MNRPTTTSSAADAPRGGAAAGTSRGNGGSSGRTRNNTQPPRHPWCDVCWQAPGFRNMTFQRCVECGVGVHNECYGICGVPRVMRAQSDWRCRACRAVGTKVTMRDSNSNCKNKSGTKSSSRSSNNHTNREEETLITVAIDERPTECCLCSVDDGAEWYHAMHPIYDGAGRTARPLKLPPTREHPFVRPAWAHTLCCYALYTHEQTKGCVFACFADGSFPNTEGAVEGDEGSVNSTLEEKDPLDDSVHHFGYSLPGSNPDGSDDQWSELIQELQRDAKCFICRKTDKSASSYRIPIQCVANESYECKEYRDTHASTRKGKGGTKLKPKTCTTAMHIGCAIWGGRRNKPDYQLSGCRRVYFLPGQTDAASGAVVRETFVHNYCDAHATDLYTRAATGAELLRYPKGLRVAPRPAAAAPAAVAAAAPPPRPAKRGGSSSSRRQRTTPASSRSPRIPRKDRGGGARKKKKQGWFADDDTSNSSASVHFYNKEGGAEDECDIGAFDADDNNKEDDDGEYEATTTGAPDDDDDKDDNLDDLVRTPPTPPEEDENENDNGPPAKDNDNNNQLPVPREPPIAAAQQDTNPSGTNNSSDERIMSDQEKLARAIAKEIIEKELNRADDHLQQLLETAKTDWSDRVDEQEDAEAVWNEVDKVLSEELGYSAEETDWTGDENTATIALDLKDWDTVEVLCIGPPPPCGPKED